VQDAGMFDGIVKPIDFAQAVTTYRSLVLFITYWITLIYIATKVTPTSLAKLYQLGNYQLFLKIPHLILKHLPI